MTSSHQTAGQDADPLNAFADCHAAIRQAMSVLESPTAPAGERAGAIAFLAGEVSHHHELEERELFPRLLARLPASEQDEVIAVVVALRADHRQLEAQWRMLAPGLSGPAHGDIDAALATFAASLRQHLKREDEVILPLARRLFNDADLAGLHVAAHRSAC